MTSPIIRVARSEDIPSIVRLVNAAFIVESFFKIGDRTNSQEVRAMMRRGEFHLLEDPSGNTVGCAFLSIAADRAYFGMLSIDPAHQGKGHGRRLIDAVEAAARAEGCRSIDIHIVNLRAELPGFYHRLGYAETGTLPFSHPEQASQPCHFVVMTKPLAPLELPERNGS